MRLPVIALLCALAACQQQARSAPEPAEVSFEGAAVTEASARVAHGDRLMSVLGCRGCHTATLQGQQFYELYASNLTRDVRNYSDAELERLIRDGVHPTGRDVWGMPSEIFQHLSDSDLKAVIAYLRTLEPAGPSTGKPLPFGQEVQAMIDQGVFKPAHLAVADSAAKGPADLGPRHALGRYIARVTCAECHGPELKGDGRGSPDLVTAGAYTREEFERLITQGVPTGGRKLNELMEVVAQGRFTKLTPGERDALYAYLKATAEQPQ